MPHRRFPSLLLGLLLALLARESAQACQAAPAATSAATSAWPTGLTFEVHGGYGSGGLHPDALVGLGLTANVSPEVEAGAFATAVVAREGGQTIFAGPELRVLLLRGPWRPYLAGGALYAWRDYADEQFGGFASAGLEARFEGSHRWAAFVEGRALSDGDKWAQVLGGVRGVFVVW